MFNILVTLVNYHCSAEILSFVARLAELKLKSRLYIAVCDNSGEFEVAGLQSVCGRLEFSVVSGQGNIGYLPGCIHLYEKDLWPEVEFDFLWVTNSDIRLEDDFLLVMEGALAHCLENRKAYAPMVRLASGSRQNPLFVDRVSRAKLGLIDLQSRYYVFHLVYGLFKGVKNMLFSRVGGGDRDLSAVYAAHGSSFVLPIMLLRKFSRPFESFLFCEELYVAEELRRIGASFYIDSSNIVIHDEHISLSSIPSKSQVKWLNDSVRWIIKNYW